MTRSTATAGSTKKRGRCGFQSSARWICWRSGDCRCGRSQPREMKAARQTRQKRVAGRMKRAAPTGKSVISELKKTQFDCGGSGDGCGTRGNGFGADQQRSDVSAGE